MTPVEFENLANNVEQGSGYLKSWKANSILQVLATIPDIFKDRVCLRQFFDDCLKMEGFTDRGIDEITDVFMKRFGTISTTIRSEEEILTAYRNGDTLTDSELTRLRNDMNDIANLTGKYGDIFKLVRDYARIVENNCTSFLHARNNKN